MKSIQTFNTLEIMFQKLASAIDAVLRFVKTVSLFVLLIVGVIIIASSVGFSFFIPLKILAVFFASLGSILGTAIICLILPKLTAAKLESEKLKSEQDLRAKIELEAKARQAESLQMEIANKDREIERLRNMTISVEGYQGVFKLTLLEIDGVIKDFCHKELFRESPKGLMRGEIHEYVGLLERRFKVSLGVNLQKLRIREDTSGAIVISGVQSEFHGFPQLPEDDWKLEEVRVKKQGGLLPNSYSVLSGDNRLLKEKADQEKFLKERMNKGAEFKNFDSALKGLAKEVIKLLLTPLGKKLVFVEGEDTTGVPLLDFIQKSDQSIQQKIIEIESSKQKLLAEKK